ncbi:MAG: cytochrome c oxidase subunit II [Trueperaceae bacterium]|nr:cytochrome c oxidase subunit II [Trueperaceae bacterium]
MPNRRWFRLIGLSILFILLLGGCSFDTIQSALDPQAPIPRAQHDLLIWVSWLSLIVILGVGGVLFVSLIRFRAKANDDRIPTQSHGNTALEIGLIALATVITILVVVPSVRTIFKTEGRIQAEDITADDIIVNVTGYQWWWAFDYPDLGITTANELHIPKGKRVILNLASADVLHSFWVPKLSGKRDLIPNQDNQLWFVTDENTPEGVYYGQCAELCLGAHAYMRFRVIVDSEADFATWIDKFQSIAPLQASTQASVQLVQVDPQIEQGKLLFKQKGCGACHAIKGYSGGAPDKPNLTNFGLRNSLAAGVLEMPADDLELKKEHLMRWLRDPQEVKPTNRMPTLWAQDDPKADEEIAAIAAYLLSLGNEAETQASVGGNYGN